MYINKCWVCTHKSIDDKTRPTTTLHAYVCVRVNTHKRINWDYYNGMVALNVLCVGHTVCAVWMHTAYIKTMCDDIQSAEHLTDYCQIQISFRFHLHLKFSKTRFHSFQWKRSHQFLFTRNKKSVLCFLRHTGFAHNFYWHKCSLLR